jgi:Gram-negative bacterial TonB protein C-terminal
MNVMNRLSPLQISVCAHLTVATVILFFTFDFFKPVKKINFSVIDNPVIAPSNLVLQPKNETRPPETVKPIPDSSQKVFGLSRKAMTTSKSGATVVKLGNTVTKENDDLKLKPTDADSLPIPADDYLVTSGAKLISSVIANRTDEARKAGYIGSAVLVLLIDREGLVREVQLLNQLEFGLGEKAIEIAKQLKFSPAKIKDDPVATKIRFSIHFKSSN